MTNTIKLFIIALSIFSSGCEFYVHQNTTTSACDYDYIYQEEYYIEPSPFTPPGHPNYCSEVNEYGECICVVYIYSYDYECRQEFCFYWDTCMWEKYDAWCHY